LNLPEDCIPSDPQDVTWDVVIVGTGAGGGPAGLNLARRGKSVLFLERGSLSDPQQLSPVAGKVDTGSFPYADAPCFRMGSGIGGSTALFGMAMDRFRPVDFTPHRFAHLAPAATLPDMWPIQYEDLDPYYREAEVLFRLRGSVDPLTPVRGGLLDPQVPSEAEERMTGMLTRAGLHPYSLHYAREQLPGCDACLGKPCARPCRNDVGRMCVIPAIENGARILPGCVALKLETRGRSIHQVHCRWNGRPVAIRGRHFILALNALSTPTLLLRSANDTFPDGVGNSSGLVGRNLMAHVSDYLAVRFDGMGGQINAQLHNGISLNDFYFRDGMKLGNLHAHSMDVSYFLERMEPRCRPDETLGTALFFTILEDFPYAENRVTPQAGAEEECWWEYHYPDELRRRATMLLTSFASAIPGCEVIARKPSGILNASHACGTCRFGDDPRSSVLDRNNKMHDLENVYVLDASFFPSSGGISPSLTIVANSLRVSSQIAN